MTKTNIQRKYHLFDAEGESIGRVATAAVKVLRGKNKVNFTPNIDGGDFAVVINASKVNITGNKKEGKFYYRFSGYPGGIKKISLKDQMEKDPLVVIKKAVYGMLPKNKLRDQMIKRLLIFADSEHGKTIDGEDFSKK